MHTPHVFSKLELYQMSTLHPVQPPPPNLNSIFHWVAFDALLTQAGLTGSLRPPLSAGEASGNQSQLRQGLAIFLPEVL